FEDLARQVFRDPRLSLNGGDLGYFTAGEMDPAFEEAAFNLPPGEVSVPVQTENGYSIIRVEDRQVAPLVTETEYANQKKIIRRYLRWKREKLGERGYIRDVLKTADPRFDRSGLSALLAIIKDLQANPSSLDTLYINLPRDVQDQYGSLSCVQFENEKWDVQAVVARLAQVAPKHLQLVQDEASLKMLLQGLVARELLYQRALDMGVDDLKSTREALAKAQRYAKSRYMRLMVYDTVAVPEAELREAYEKRRHEYYFPEEVRVQVLIAGDSLTALRLRKMALEGSDFTALVHQHSLGIGERNPDGIFDWSPRGKFGTFADQIFELKVAQITAPVKGEGYYLLFKLLDRRPRRDKTFSEARGQIEAELLPPRQRDRFLEFIRRERRQRQIVKDPDALAKMPLIKSAA
ncbi:MAG: peptidyl-prolyl cis-trans isomerase, partial [Calditrichaeota bacterium]|nr:peptidyl-prolyl cis-trans isomerase [Calditrichota bacterium]